MNPTPKRFSFKAMGSFCEIQLFDESRIHAKNVVNQLADEVARLEKKYSRFREDSLLTEINSSAGNKLGLAIDNETQSLFDHALNCFEQSDGLFDITTGALSKIWNFKKALVPSQSQIDTARSHVGLNKISCKDSHIYLPQGMQIDFGGIVKEYAVDSVARMARRLGVEHGLVNLGGDFSVIGSQPGNKPWAVGISSPESKSGVMAKIDLLDGGLASSGDYERFFMHEGRRYSHILNPITGWPSNGLRAVSIAANLCSVAGSVATIAMLKDELEAKAWLEDSGLAYVYMDSEETLGNAGLNSRN
ncbi:MAG: thiamine biosynthesis protein ApbE [SAR86 cluster bacterium]|uniref:FAD:protein FMN transferase n=1 Tax=SAR86 cluster bacterium TaxID=2030880 RepID=A0A2A4XBR8_9GAMM|nr:MAG: thiamine biosynthesis protein ApbE [SAR86 cluster bacterium]